jgi:hypothetical protein
MVLYICHFCNYASNNKNEYYIHNYKHLTPENIDSFTPEEIQLCNYYKDLKINREKEYYEKNKDKIKERNKEYMKEYHMKNKEKMKEYNKEYREKNKAYILQKHKEYMKKYRQRKEMTKQDE